MYLDKENQKSFVSNVSDRNSEKSELTTLPEISSL